MKESGFDSGFIKSVTDINIFENATKNGNKMIGYILRNGAAYEQEIGINPILASFGVHPAASVDLSRFRITTCPSGLNYHNESGNAYLYFNCVVDKMDGIVLDRCLRRQPRKSSVSAWSSKGFESYR